MKILLYSSAFYPSVGGVETITATLADGIHRAGHEVIVLTETSDDRKNEFPFEVIRRPGFWERYRLVRQADVVHSNGASTAMFPYAHLAGVPFMWTHNGYQVSCVDGLGWQGHEATPMEPWASVKYYLKKEGWIFAIKATLKLFYRRFIAFNYALNVAATHWVAHRQPLPNQLVAYTPYPLGRFSRLVRKAEVVYDFIFVGRLVGEKGLRTMLLAFHEFLQGREHLKCQLAIAGDGPLKDGLQDLARNLQIEKNVHFLGVLNGDELTNIVGSASIGIVPSEYEEPMGGVALELLAGGCNVIVAKRSGMAECVGDAGMLFDNGNAGELCYSMKMLLENPDLAARQRDNAKTQIGLFSESLLVAQYIKIYQGLVSGSSER